MALQSLLLIPRTPSLPHSPTPVPPEDRDFDDLTMHEKQEVPRRLHVRQSYPHVSILFADPLQARYRRERSIKMKTEPGAVKRERNDDVGSLIAGTSVKKAKTRAFKKGEMVNLDD